MELDRMELDRMDVRNVGKIRNKDRKFKAEERSEVI
jgi:hypothetical protein